MTWSYPILFMRVILSWYMYDDMARWRVWVTRLHCPPIDLTSIVNSGSESTFICFLDLEFNLDITSLKLVSGLHHFKHSKNFELQWNPPYSSVGCSIQCQAAGLGWGIHLSHFYSHAFGLWNLCASRCILNFQTWVGWSGWKPNFYFEQAAVKPKPTKSPVWAAWRPWTSVRMVCCFAYPRGFLGYKSYITIN